MSTDVDPHQLTSMGKRAAQLWAENKVTSLSMGAAEVLKTAGHTLNREQMARVVEATNHAAYTYTHGNKLAGETHRYVTFAGGPARLEDVVKQATGLPEPVTYRNLSDYENPPPSQQKTASWEELFGVEKFAFSLEAEGPVVDGRHEVKLALAQLTSALENVQGALDLEEMALDQLRPKLANAMYRAHLEGATLNDMVRGLASVDGSPDMIKAAFKIAYPQLEKLHSPASYAESLKVASAGILNEEHPMLEVYRDLIEGSLKVASLRAACEELEMGRFALLEVQQKVAEMPPSQGAAAGAAARSAVDRYLHFANQAGQHVGDFGEAFAGKGARGAGTLVSGAIKAAPLLAAGAVGLRALDHGRAAMDSPLGRKIQSFIPGTDENLMASARVRQMYGADQGYMPMGY